MSDLSLPNTNFHGFLDYINSMF